MRIDCDYRPNHVHVAVKPRHLEELAEWARELHEDYGYSSVQLLNRDELQGHVRSERYLAGLLDPRSGHLQPLKYTQGLARAAEMAGAVLYENSRSACATRTAARCACTPRKAACAARIWFYAAMPTSAPSRRRWRGAFSASAPTSLPPNRWVKARAQFLPSNAAVADINWILDYFRRSADHRLLFGGRVSYSSVQPPRLAESMRRRMVRVFPSLADVKVANAWGGYLDITMSRAPNFGRLAPQRLLPAGFLGARRGARRIGRQPGRRGHRGDGGTIRCVCAHTASGFSRRPVACGGRRWCWRCSTTGCGISVGCVEAACYLSPGFSEAAKLAESF